MRVSCENVSIKKPDCLQYSKWCAISLTYKFYACVREVYRNDISSWNSYSWPLTTDSTDTTMYPRGTSVWSVSSVFFLANSRINLMFKKYIYCVQLNKEISFWHFSVLNFNSFIRLSEWFCIFPNVVIFIVWHLTMITSIYCLVNKKVTNEKQNFWSQVTTQRSLLTVIL